MPQPTGPFALSAGVPVSQRPPQGLLNPTQVVAINKSPYEIVITSPTTKTLPAWTADQIGSTNPIPGSAPAGAISGVTGTPTLAPGYPSTSVLAANLYLDWYGPGEQIPTGLPFSLAADAITSSVIVAELFDPPTATIVHTIYSVLVPNGVVTPIIAAPAAGMCWEVVSAVIAAAHDATATNTCFIADATTGNLWQGTATITGTPVIGLTWGGRALFDVGLSGHNSLGVDVSMGVAARQIPFT